MDGELYAWAKRMEVEREMARQALIIEAKRLAARDEAEDK
jgi:hypothetical protein